MSSETLQPDEVQVIGTELAIRWSDHSETYLPLETVRRHCPCAACGGEPDLVGSVDLAAIAARTQAALTEKSFGLTALHRVGGYALQPVWTDGHSSGIYTFAYLRKLAEPANA